jgi:hypothetical protein
VNSTTGAEAVGFEPTVPRGYNGFRGRPRESSRSVEIPLNWTYVVRLSTVFGPVGPNSLEFMDRIMDRKWVPKGLRGGRDSAVRRDATSRADGIECGEEGAPRSRAQRATGDSSPTGFCCRRSWRLVAPSEARGSAICCARVFVESVHLV